MKRNEEVEKNGEKENRIGFVSKMILRDIRKSSSSERERNGMNEPRQPF